MIKNGLNRIKADHRDFSIVHTFGATFADVQSLPANFSIYDGRPIPDQNTPDTRFTPPLPPLEEGCTGETGTFDAGLQDGVLYNPKDLYDHTPPGGQGGRDIRVTLQTLIDRGPMKADGTFGPKRTAYFNCYGSGAIDDFDAARIGVWINQNEKRGVWVGSFWYIEFESPAPDGSLPVPSYNTNLPTTTMHCHLITGWRTRSDGVLQVQDISWQGENYAQAGLDYLTREEFNALLAQPYTASYTITKLSGNTPIPIGMVAYYDQMVAVLVQFVKGLFHV